LPVCPECKSAFLKQDVNDHTLMYCPKCKASFRLYAVEPSALIQKAVISQLRWMCKLTKEQPDSLKLSEEDAMLLLVELDEALRLCMKEEG
jgi:Zn-finger nucleic acid-binding protein